MIWMALWWGGPIGLGIFFMGLGMLAWGVGQARRKI